MINSAPLILTRKCYYKCSQRSNQYIYRKLLHIFILAAAVICPAGLNQFNADLFGTIESNMNHATARLKVAPTLFSTALVRSYHHRSRFPFFDNKTEQQDCVFTSVRPALLVWHDPTQTYHESFSKSETLACGPSVSAPPIGIKTENIHIR